MRKHIEEETKAGGGISVHIEEETIEEETKVGGGISVQTEEQAQKASEL